MKLYTHRKAILSALHEARKLQGFPEVSRAGDAAAMRHIRSVARSFFFLPGKDALAHRKKSLTDLSKAREKTNGSLKEARNCPDAMAAPRTAAPGDLDGDAVAAVLNKFADSLQSFAELTARAERVSARRIKIECLVEFFTPAYEQHSGAAPVRCYVGGEHEGAAYGPYLDYICAIAAALDVKCSPEGVASVFRRMDKEGERLVQEQYVPWEDRHRAYLQFAGVDD